MRKQLTKIALATGIVLALVFTFSCSSDDGGNDNSGSLTGNSSSSGGISSSSVLCDASLFAGGNGTEANPYQVSTPEQLQNLNCYDNYKTIYYALNNDIDLTSYLSEAGNNSGAGWLPIKSFRGKLNGNGYKVSGLWINRHEKNALGLFGFVSNGADIRNVGVEIDNAKGGVSGGSDGNVGGLVGVNVGTISNSYATGDVSGDFSNGVGGLVGKNSGTISDSYTMGMVHNNGVRILVNFNVGGLVGENDGTISDSYAMGMVHNDQSGASKRIYIGGLVGGNNGTISDSYASGKVSSAVNTDVGGLVGRNTGIIGNSYASGEVSDSCGNLGGLVGRNTGTIGNSYASGKVSNKVVASGKFGNVGGLVGLNESGTINISYAIGNVSADKGYSYVGGLVGQNGYYDSYSFASDSGAISNSYAKGEVSSSGSIFILNEVVGIGGLVGKNNKGSTISNSYASGKVSTGSSSVVLGGLVGINNDPDVNVSIISSYYDRETSRQDDSGKGEGRSTEEMQTQSTYVGWDFTSIWEIKPAKSLYPTLQMR